MSRRPLPFFENVTIIDAGAEGKAVARVNDLVVFVPFCVPGDVVDIQVISKRKSYFRRARNRKHFGGLYSIGI